MKRNEKQLSETLSKFKQYYHLQVMLDKQGFVAAINEGKRQVNALSKIKPHEVTAITFVVNGRAVKITDEGLCREISTHAVNLEIPREIEKHKTTHAPYVFMYIEKLSKLIDEPLWKKAATISKLISEVTEPHKHYSQKYCFDVLKSLQP